MPQSRHSDSTRKSKWDRHRILSGEKSEKTPRKPLVEYDSFSSSDSEPSKSKKQTSSNTCSRKVGLKSRISQKSVHTKTDKEQSKSTHSSHQSEKKSKKDSQLSLERKSEKSSSSRSKSSNKAPESTKTKDRRIVQLSHKKENNIKSNTSKRKSGKEKSRSSTSSSSTSSDITDEKMDRRPPPPGFDYRPFPGPPRSPGRNGFHDRTPFPPHPHGLPPDNWDPARFDRMRSSPPPPRRFSPHHPPPPGYPRGPPLPIIRRSVSPPPGNRSPHFRVHSPLRREIFPEQRFMESDVRPYGSRSPRSPPQFNHDPRAFTPPPGNISGIRFPMHDVDMRVGQLPPPPSGLSTQQQVIPLNNINHTAPMPPQSQSDDSRIRHSRDHSSSRSRSRSKHKRKKHKKKTSSRKHGKRKSSRRRSRSASRSDSSETDDDSQAEKSKKKKKIETTPTMMTVKDLAAQLSKHRKKLAAEKAGSALDDDDDKGHRRHHKSKKRRKDKKSHKDRKRREGSRKRKRESGSESDEDEEEKTSSVDVTTTEGSIHITDPMLPPDLKKLSGKEQGVNPDVLLTLSSASHSGNNITVPISDDSTRTQPVTRLRDMDYRIDQMLAQQQVQSNQITTTTTNIPVSTGNLVVVKQEAEATSNEVQPTETSQTDLKKIKLSEDVKTEPEAPVKEEPQGRTKRGLHDLPLPPVLPVVSAAEEEPVRTPPAAVEKEIPKRKRPSLCGPRTREVTQRVNDWGSMCVDEYEFISITGEGTFGQVYKASEKRTGAICALKKVRLDNEREGFPITAVREIKILRQLQHPNIVSLKDVLTDKSDATDFRKEKGCAFYLVFEYMDHDLMGLLESGMVHFNEGHIKSFMRQLLDGLNHCHQKGFLHRDIKCSNILLNNKGEIKLADFGLARFYHQDEPRPYTNRVITLWYRPPELLLGEETYTPAIDIWSCGCILAELFTKKPLFQADRELAQLECISRICGSPCPAVWPDVIRLPHFHTMKPKRQYRRRLREEFAYLPTLAIDLLDQMLTLDPSKRFTAEEALNCPWLQNVDPNNMSMPDFPHWQDCHEMWSKKRRKELRENAKLVAEGKPPIHDVTSEPPKATASTSGSSSKDSDLRQKSSASTSKAAPAKEANVGKSSDQDALMKLIKDNPDINLAQLARAWNVPIDSETVKFMSTVNIKGLVAALNQKSGADPSVGGLNVLVEQLKNNLSKAMLAKAAPTSTDQPNDDKGPKINVAPIPSRPGLQGPTSSHITLKSEPAEARQIQRGPSSSHKQASASYEKPAPAANKLIKDVDLRVRASRVNKPTSGKSALTPESSLEGRTAEIPSQDADEVKKRLAKLIAQQLLDKKIGSDIHPSSFASVLGGMSSSPKDVDMRQKSQRGPPGKGRHGS